MKQKEKYEKIAKAIIHYGAKKKLTVNEELLINRLIEYYKIDGLSCDEYENVKYAFLMGYIRRYKTYTAKYSVINELAELLYISERTAERWLKEIFDRAIFIAEKILDLDIFDE